MSRRDVLLVLLGVLFVALWSVNAWNVNRARNVAPATVNTSLPDGYRTAGFEAAPGFFAERDVQYIGTTGHCIVRLTRADAPESVASYLEVPMQWCEGVQ